jgi:hypothetical protein
MTNETFTLKLPWMYGNQNSFRLKLIKNRRSLNSKSFKTTEIQYFECFLFFRILFPERIKLCFQEVNFSFHIHFGFSNWTS